MRRRLPSYIAGTVFVFGLAYAALLTYLFARVRPVPMALLPLDRLPVRRAGRG